MTTTQAALQAVSLAPGLTVNDLARSIGFYEGLGFAVDQKWEDGDKLLGVMLKAGEAQLGLSQDDWAKGRDRPKGVALRIWISTKQNVDELAKLAKAAGLTLDDEPADMPWGGRAFAVTDPDGFKLTISCESQSSEG